MIDIIKVDGNTIAVRPEGRLHPGDFDRIAERIDNLIKQKGKIRLIIDGRAFHGWSDVKAAEEHFRFIRDHHKKVERVAAVAPYEGIKWLAEITNVFVAADVKMFDLNEIESAREWAAGAS